MSKNHLLQQATEAFEHFITVAQQTAQRGVTRRGDTWGPRKVVAHMAGWEAFAHARISQIAAGLPSFEFNEPDQVDDAINAMIVTVAGDQSLDALCAILRQTYQRNIELLGSLGETRFRPGEYVYDRTLGVIEHCQEHAKALQEL